MKHYIAAVLWTGSLLDKYADFDTETEAESHVSEFGGFVATNPGGETFYWIIDGVAETITVNNALHLSDAVTSQKSLISEALSSRLNQGILWKYNSGSTSYAIPLNFETRAFLRTLDGQFVRGETNPHDGYLQFDGERLLSNTGGALPDAAVEEILDFSSQWGLNVSRIAINEKASIDGMDLAEVLAYDASLIDWKVTWVGHSDWIDDLVKYIPNT